MEVPLTLALSRKGRENFPLPRRERTEVRVKVKTPHSSSLPQGEREPLILSLDGRGLR